MLKWLDWTTSFPGFFPSRPLVPPGNEVVNWIVAWLDWISLQTSLTACHSRPTAILDYSLRKICEIVRFALRAAIWLGAIIWRTVFQCWRLVKKSSSIDPEAPEKAIVSVFKSYLVHLGSFKRHILYFCASIIEKIRSHWGEPYEAKFVVVSVPTNGSNVAFNVVIWLSFLSIKVLQSTIYLWRIFFKR